MPVSDMETTRIYTDLLEDVTFPNEEGIGTESVRFSCPVPLISGRATYDSIVKGEFSVFPREPGNQQATVPSDTLVSYVLDVVKNYYVLEPRSVSARKRFESLCKEWKSELNPSSSIAQLAMHPAYQSIIGMGTVAVPYILKELEKELDHWFWALRAITGEDPVPEPSRGRLSEMRECWLDWGRKWLVQKRF